MPKTGKTVALSDETAGRLDAAAAELAKREGIPVSRSGLAEHWLKEKLDALDAKAAKPSKAGKR